MLNRLSMFTLMWVAILIPPVAYATEYYASPTGSGSACSSGTPCKINSFWAKAKPGDTLNLTAGVYTGSDSMINPPADYSSTNGGVCLSLFGGSAAAPVTVRAINDGKAIIDGQYARQPARLLCAQYIVLEGMRFQNSSGDVIAVWRSSHNILRRISAYNANYHLMPDPVACPGVRYDNYHVLDVIYQSTYNLVEDSIFGGSGRNLINTFSESNFNIFRRNILVGGGYVRENQIPGCNTPSSDNHGEAFQLYGSSDNVVENVVAFGIGDWQGQERRLQSGMNIWVNRNQQAHRNKYYGTLVMDYPGYGFYHASVCNLPNDSDMCLTDAYYENVVAFRNGKNIFARNGRGNIIRNSSFLQAGQGFSSSSSTPRSGIYTDQGYDNDKSSSWLYEDTLVAGNEYGCYGTGNLSPQDVTFNYVLFYDNTKGNFYSRCADAVMTNVKQGVNPQLKSLVYIDPSSPAYSAGKNGGQVGADLRCKYVSRFENGNVITEQTSMSLWPLPDLINERVKVETLEVHGTAYDVNAKVLDAMGPRDLQKIRCLQKTPGYRYLAPPTGLVAQ